MFEENPSKNFFKFLGFFFFGVLVIAIGWYSFAAMQFFHANQKANNNIQTILHLKDHTP